VTSACAALWGYRLFVKPIPVPAHAGSASTAQSLRGDPVLLLGATPEAPADEAEEPLAVAASRFQLLGVVAPRAAAASREGLALIAIDGKPARAYRVGAAVDGELVLQTVRARGADLGARGGPPAVALNLAGLPPPATGVPGRPMPTGPAAGGAGGPGAQPQAGSPGVLRPGVSPQARQLGLARPASNDDDESVGGESDHSGGEGSAVPPGQRQLLTTH
jgi:general secretion pathway protein C